MNEKELKQHTFTAGEYLSTRVKSSVLLAFWLKFHGLFGFDTSVSKLLLGLYYVFHLL